MKGTETERTVNEQSNFSDTFWRCSTSLYNLPLTQNIRQYTISGNSDSLRAIRKEVGRYLIALSLGTLVLGASTTIVPGIVFNLAMIHVLSYTVNKLADELLQNATTSDGYNKERFTNLATFLKGVSDNIMVLGFAVFASAGVTSALNIVMHNHLSAIVGTLAVVLSRGIGFELNKLKSSYFEHEHSSTSNTDYVEKFMINSLGFKLFTSTISGSFLGSLLSFSILRSSNDIFFAAEKDISKMPDKANENAHKFIMHAIDFIGMSVFDAVLSNTFLSSTALTGLVSKAVYFETYKHIVDVPLSTHLKSLEIGSTVSNIYKWAQSNAAKILMTGEQATKELGA